MDWGFLDIFKKAEFNSLMLSVAITGWIMYYFKIQDYVFGIAILASSYCLIRLFVYCYQIISENRERNNNAKQLALAKKLEEKEKIESRNVEISRMFEGLSDDNLNVLLFVFEKGKRDSRNYNILHFPKYGEEAMLANQARSITMIFRGPFGDGQPCISIKKYTDTIAVTIDPFLYDLIRKHIERVK